MGLIKAVKNMFRVKSMQAEKALVNPVDQSKLDIMDSEKQVSKFKQAIAHAMAQNSVLGKQKDTAQADVEKYERIAKMAVQAGNDADAREALEAKVNAQSLFNSLAHEIDANNAIISDQRKQLDRAEKTITKAKNNQAILASRLEGANARKDLASAGSLDGNGPLASLDNLQKAVDQAEGEADAIETLNHTHDIPLEEKYDASKFSIDNELARLKAAS